MSTLTLLPRRSSLLPGESLLSLLVRLERLNYYEPGTIVHLCQMTGDLAHLARSDQANTFTQMSLLTGLDPSQLFGASEHCFASLRTASCGMSVILPNGQIRPLLRPYDRFLRPTQQAHFCPVCLQTAAYHRLIWSFPLVTLCLAHDCQLAHTCPRCDRTVSVAELVTRQCRVCQADLSQSPLHPADDPSQLHSQRSIQRWLMANLSPQPNASRPDSQPGPKREWVDPIQAGQILNLSEATLIRSALQGQLHPAYLPTGQHRWCFFRHDVLLKLAQEWKTGVPLREVCCWLGLTKSVVVGLVKNQMLKRESGPPYSPQEWLLNQHSVVEFIRTITCRLSPSSERRAIWSLAAAAHQLARVRLDQAALLKLIAEGRIPAYYRGAWKERLASLYLTSTDLESLMHAIASERHWTSDEELAQWLEVSPQALFPLWKKFGAYYGLQPVAYDGIMAYFESRAARQFCANCLNDEQAAQKLGVSKATLMEKYVLTDRLFALVDPRYDGGQHYLFWRKDVQVFCR